MHRRAFLTGTVGGIVGAITAVIGIIWSLMKLFQPNPFDFYFPYASYTTIANHLRWAIKQSDWFFNFFLISIIFTIFLILSGILLSVGFLGFYAIAKGDEAIGDNGETGDNDEAGDIVAIAVIVICVLGNAFVAFFIILGVMQPIIELKTLTPYTSHYALPILEPLTQTIIITPNYFFFSAGLLALIITLIALGLISISMRDITMVPSISSSSGIISILGALFLLPYSLLLTSFIAIIGIISGFIGFTLILVAFILLAAVFFSSRNI